MSASQPPSNPPPEPAAPTPSVDAAPAPSVRPLGSFLARTWEAWAALGAALVVLVVPIGKAGIWDPFELNVAELARRFAVNRLHGTKLLIEGADNSMMTLHDLGRGELPFDSIAVGFRLFGLHEWAGRLPLALWGVMGAMSLYWALARLIDRRAGLYGALILITMPLYFLQSRTMLGDIVTMAASSMAFAGLAIGVFDRGLRLSLGRVLAVGLALVGLASGFMCRGLLVGVALPALGVGLAWVVTWGAASGKAHRELYGDIVGAACLLVGVAALGVGLYVLMNAKTTEYSVFVGTAVSTQPKFPTFDFVILYLGHALLPWSAFVPFAAGRLFREPPLSGTDAETEAARGRETSLRLGVLVASAIAFGGYSIVAPRLGYIPFGAPALLAAIAAVAIRDYERGAPSSRAIGVGVAVLAALYLRDYNMFPDKGLSAFAVAGTFPDSLKETASNLVLASTLVFAGLVFLAWLERENEPYFRWRDYLVWPKTLVLAWNGNLFLGLVTIQLLLTGLAAYVFVGLRVLHLKPVLAMAVDTRYHALNTFWKFPLLLFGVVWGAMAVRDAFRFFIKKTGIPRAVVSLAAGVLVGGGLLSFWYYPALGAQTSPKEVFDAYRQKHRGDEPLGLLGVGGRSASYSSGGDVEDVDRRQLGLRVADSRPDAPLARRPRGRSVAPQLDLQEPRHRSEAEPARPRCSFEPDPARLERAPRGREESEPVRVHSLVVRAADPAQGVCEPSGPARVARLGDPRGERQVGRCHHGRPGKYRFRLFYKVLAATSGEWETFVHVDGFKRRYNGDHKTVGGKYPFNLWQPGDYIVDDAELQLEPNFTAGQYTMYYGLYVGETRMKVKTGRHDDNRIDGGPIRVQ